jgi:hypothetical protein
MAPPPDRSRRLPLILGGAVAALGFVVVAGLAMRRPPAPPPSVVLPEIKVPPKPPPGAVKAEEPGRADLEKARALAKKSPEDLSAHLRAYTDIVWKFEGSEAAREAAREAASVKAAIHSKVTVWMSELEAQIKDLLDAKDYAAAERKIEELKKSHDLPEWRLAAERRASEIFLMSKKGPEAPVAKAPSAEAKAYAATWESAAAKATARNFGGAIAELEQSAAALKEAEVRQELESDVALLRKVAAVHQAAMEQLTKRPRGSGLTLAVRDGKRISGAVLQIDDERVEIRSGKTSEFVEWGDVTAATIVEIAQQGNFEPAVLAAICILDGDREGAKAFESEPAPKWGRYTAKPPKPDPAEKNARDLYAAAEKGFRSMETLAGAVDNYKSLRADFGTTSLVKKYSERIFKRSEAGREYYFAPVDFRIDGTFQRTKSGKIESAKDSDGQDTLLNSAEIEFAVLPGQAYRCWLLVGACCEETFFFYYQGTEVTETDPKTKKKIACEPGSTFAAPVKHSIRNLKKTHEEHKIKGAKVHPKTAARWEWIEIVLPKYAGPGAKKLKFATNQAGFSIGGCSVSSTRKAPPTESEMVRTTEEKPPEPIDPDLVAWWTFEDGSGDQVTDVSGKKHTGKFVGAVQWAEGKVGGGLQVGGGPKSGVEVADAQDLRIAGDLTIALWVKMTAPSEDWVCLLGRGSYDQRNYGLWIEPKTRKILYQNYGILLNFYANKLLEVGRWTHLAVTIEGTSAKIYVDGQMDAQDTKTGPPHTNPATLGIGSAIHHGSLTGVMDDVRLYRRALTAEEIRAIYQGGR